MAHRRGVTAILLAVATTLFLSLGLAGQAQAAPRTADAAVADVTGATADGANTFDGTFTVERFVNDGGQLMAVGALTGTITDAAGTVTDVSQQVSIPVDLDASSGSCQILHLVLGPLDLDLLGLQVFLDTVTLDITAQPGPGNLLGNLLCAVAGLLDGPTGLNAIVTQIANLLNQLLGILR
ncbi:MAG: ABC transporter substrate-binding protein [Actinomycetes bacterium]